jgi:hypothetical protein
VDGEGEAANRRIVDRERQQVEHGIGWLRRIFR